MLELEQLIQKFWANQTTLAENKRLLQLLELYRSTVKDSMQDNFQESEPLHNDGLRPDRALSILERIHSNLGMTDLAEAQKTRTASIRKLYHRIAVAASVCILTMSLFLLTSRHHEKEQLAKVIGPAIPGTIPPMPKLIRLVNEHEAVLSVTLKDGSTVQLEKNSSLSYYDSFTNDRRDLSLSGIAVFKVAKDKTRPFTVYAGGLATRALGTRFLVNAADPGKIKIRLLEGKISVSSAAGSDLTMKEVLLTPGQELSFDRTSQVYAVGTVAARPGDAARRTIPDNKPDLVFHKEPLGSVFEKVASLYKVPLSYQKEVLDGLYFTGTFLKSDNLNIVLSTICNVNDLLVTKSGDSIIISKSH
jgi:transmembrane sensor